MSKPLSRVRGSLIAVLDIGTTKVCCFVARLEPAGPRVIGIGHQISHGIRAGEIVDIDAAATSILNAVHAAEQMAGETVTRIFVNLSGGFLPSRITPIEIPLGGRMVDDEDVKKVVTLGHAYRDSADRQVVHSVPVGYSIDGSRGIHDPKGMTGQRLGVNMHIVSATSAAVRNVMAAAGRCHLTVEGIVVSPYAAGLSALVEDEMQLGVTLIDMGGGTTTIGVFYDNAIIYADTIKIGGRHVTNDIARGLSTPIAHAERMKTLYGSAIRSPNDDRETINIPIVGEEDNGPNNVPKSQLINIILPRLEETFDLVMHRLRASGFDKLAGRQAVLTGGACQLPGTRELAQRILDKQVRIGRPSGVNGLAEASSGPAFATAAGILLFATTEKRELLSRESHQKDAPRGVIGRFGSWLRDNI